MVDLFYLFNHALFYLTDYISLVLLTNLQLYHWLILLAITHLFLTIYTYLIVTDTTIIVSRKLFESWFWIDKIYF